MLGESHIILQDCVDVPGKVIVGAEAELGDRQEGAGKVDF